MKFYMIYNISEKGIYMIIRILLLLLSLIVLVNLCIMTLCHITGVNIYKKYGKEMVISVCIFVFIVVAMYVALALIGLK